MSSQDNSHILITLVAISIGILLVNTILLISNARRNSESPNIRDNWDGGKGMFDNGGVYNGIGEDSNPFRTKMACACSGYGVKRTENMPFNDDSNLYNNPLQRQIREGFNTPLPDGADCGVNRDICNRVCQSKMSHSVGMITGSNPDMPLLQSYKCGP